MKTESGRSAVVVPKPHPIKDRLALLVAVSVPFAALAWAAMDLPGSKPNVTVALTAIGWYVVSTLGITVGYHRLFTHRSFSAAAWLQIALAIAGAMAIQGPLICWVAEHRRHHAFADRDGDPHSPWRFGHGSWGLCKGLLFAHVGWMLGGFRANTEVFAKDLIADRRLRKTSSLFLFWAFTGLATPALIALVVTQSINEAWTMLLWAGFLRVLLCHHVTWSVNSICHVFGERPFESRDKATDFWPLALLSLGEAWHNGHHSSPSLARHGATRRHIDISAEVIRLFECAGWATDVKWTRRQGASSNACEQVSERLETSRPDLPVGQ